MSDTTIEQDRRLPTDWATLKGGFMPREPEDTLAAKLLGAVHRLDEVIAHTVGQIDQAAAEERTLAAELVDQALTGTSLEPLARLDLDVRRSLERRLEVLRFARSIAAQRHTDAQLNDPILIRWRERCAQITAEWQTILGGDDEQRRFTQLAEFAGRYAQTPR